MKRATTAIGAAIALLVIIHGFALPASGEGLPPKTISYQGRLMTASGQPVADGTKVMDFRLLDAETGGNLLWSESASVTVVGGWVNVVLGNTNPINLPFDIQYWLEVVIDGQSLQPRTKLTSVPYAQNAARLSGFEASQVVGPSKILVLDAGGQFPNAALKMGHGQGLDADTIDGLHSRDIIVRTGSPGGGIRLEKYSYTDLNNDTGEYIHLTNGRVGVLLDSGYGATTWAMNNETVVEGQCVHCIEWEPYALQGPGYNFGPYSDNPNAELARHQQNASNFTLLDQIRYYRDEQSAMSDSATGEIDPTLINRGMDRLVFMHRHLLYPFRPVGDKYPAVQVVKPSGSVTGWGSSTDTSEYGGGTPDIADAVRCGWDGTSENLVGIVFDWDESAGTGASGSFQLRIFVHHVENRDSGWGLLAEFFPAAAAKNGASMGTLASSLPENDWLSWSIPFSLLRRGTNCVLLRTYNSSPSKYVQIGAGPVQTRLLKKNYLLTSYGPGYWGSLRRFREYYAVYRDSDKIKTWGRIDAGTDIQLDFIGGALGSAVRRAADGVDVFERFPRGIKQLVSPTRVENPNLGVKNIADPGYAPTESGWERYWCDDSNILNGLTGDNRYILFSRAGSYKTRYVFEDPGEWRSLCPRLSAYNDLYAGGPSPDGYTPDPMGYAKSWTDAPCAHSQGAIPPGTRTCTITYDYSEF